MRTRAIAIALLALVPGAGLALAATGTTLHAVKTYSLAAVRTKTFSVGYPDALEFGGARYSGSVKLLAPAGSAHGSRPSLRKVHVKDAGSTLGDSQYSATIENDNPAGSAPIRVRITATTVLPAGTG